MLMGLLIVYVVAFFFFSSRRRHTRCSRDWSSDVCSSDLKPELLFRDVPLLLALHHPAADPAELVDIEARLVELGVQPGHAFDVAHRADGPAGARPALVLGLVDDRALALALPDDRHVAVVHAAGAALMAAMVEALAQLRGLPLTHVDRRDVGRVVLDRQGTQP